MTSFYQPKSTQGIYDAAASRLTVNCGDSVLVGFRAAPKKLSDIQVDADIGAILGRYAAGPMQSNCASTLRARRGLPWKRPSNQ